MNPATDRDRDPLEEFARCLAAAGQRDASRAEMIQTMVEAAADCIGAFTTAYYERAAAGDGLLRVAIAGLFPPLRPVGQAVGEKNPTRASLLERVLREEEVLSRESAAGVVASTGRGELIADARGDARIPRHADPALAVRSIIFVPLISAAPARARAIGVLALANPLSGGAFSAEDFSLAQALAERAMGALELASARER